MENKINTIGKDFTMKELIKFVSAPVLSKLVMSLLSTIDDSLFISRYCGQNALAAFTIAMPWFMLVDAVTMTLCAIGAKCSMLMGEKKNDEANSSFTTMVIMMFGTGLIFTLVMALFKRQILTILGATDVLLPIVVRYMNISQFYMPIMLAGQMMNRFYIIAGKPKVAVASSFVQIFCNLFFDWLLIARMGIGIVGAAYGNLAGNILIVLIGLFFFSNKKEEIHFSKPINKPFKLYKEVCILGKSQGLTSLAVSVNCFIVNNVLLGIGGETFVAAYTVVNNVQFMFMNAFFGFVGSVSPIVSYAYGEKNAKKLSKQVKQATLLIEILSVLVGLFIFVFKKPIMYLYFGNNANQTIKDMVSYGFKVVPFCYSVFSFNVMVQEFLVAVGNHKASTFLSIIENVILGNIVVLTIPHFFGANGVWYCFLIAESLTFIFTCYVVNLNKDVYGYGKDEIASFVNN